MPGGGINELPITAEVCVRVVDPEFATLKPQLDQFGEEGLDGLRMLVEERITSTQESKETPTELTAVIEKMKATAKKHDNFGFGSAEALAVFLETLPQKLSPDSLATIKALKPRETEQSYTVFFKHGNDIYFGESAPSSKGPDGKEWNGVNIAATKAGKRWGLQRNWIYSETGSAEELLAQLSQNGAKDISPASKAMLKTLQALGLFSSEVYGEWLSDPAASLSACYCYAESDYLNEVDADCAHVRWGVRALRNVTSELGA